MSRCKLFLLWISFGFAVLPLFVRRLRGRAPKKNRARRRHDHRPSERKRTNTKKRHLLKHLLDTSPDLLGKVRVEAHFKGWPDDPSTLDDADTIFLTSDGTDREEKNHPLYLGRSFAGHRTTDEARLRPRFLPLEPRSVRCALAIDQITEWSVGISIMKLAARRRTTRIPSFKTWRS